MAFGRRVAGTRCPHRYAGRTTRGTHTAAMPSHCRGVGDLDRREKPPNSETTDDEMAEKPRNNETTEDEAAKTATEHRNHRKRSGQATELLTVPMFT